MHGDVGILQWVGSEEQKKGYLCLNDGRCFECHVTCTIGPLLESALHLRWSFTTQMREPILSDRQSRPEFVTMRGENKPDAITGKITEQQLKSRGELGKFAGAVGRETFDLNHLPLGQVQKRSLKHVLVNVIVFKVISFFVCFCFIKTPGTQESLSGHNEQHLHYFSSVPFQSAFCHGHADTSGPALLLCNTNTLPPYAPLSFCLHHSSLSGTGLDDGVPVEVVLDVVGRHAAYLEVSSRHHMLLVHLSVMAWGQSRGERSRRTML